MSDFSPSDRRTQELFAEHVLTYIEMMKSMIVFNGSISKRERQAIEQGFDEARIMCKRLLSNKPKKVFKDPEDWNLIG